VEIGIVGGREKLLAGFMVRFGIVFLLHVPLYRVSDKLRFIPFGVSFQSKV
jgi:hypothetical protein